MSEEKSHFRIRKGDVEIEYSGKPSDVNRQFKVASEWVKGIIAVTPPPNVSEERNTDRNEEREFQLEMLRVQLKDNRASSYGTALMTVAISYIVAMIAIVSSNISQEEKSIPTVTAYVMIVVFLSLVGLFYVNSVRTTRKLDEFQERFIESKKTENPKQDNNMMKNIWWILWGIWLSFLLQVLYDGVGEIPHYTQGFWGGFIIALVFFVVLFLLTFFIKRGKVKISNPLTEESIRKG